MDRFMRGIVSGIVGGVAMNLWTIFEVYVLKLKVVRFIDWAGVIIYGDLPRSHMEGVFALILQITWAGLLGVVLAFLLKYLTSRHYFIKAGFFGIWSGFFIYSISVLFQVPFISNTSLETAFSNYIGGLIWALTTAMVLRLLDNTSNGKT